MYMGEIFRFSDILQMMNLNPYLEKGCVVDTSILCAMSYPNDIQQMEEMLGLFLGEILLVILLKMYEMRLVMKETMQ